LKLLAVPTIVSFIHATSSVLYNLNKTEKHIILLKVNLILYFCIVL